MSKTARCSGRSIWMFGGIGTQWAGMGHALYAADAKFRLDIHQVCDALAPGLGWSPLEQFDGAADPARMQQPAVAHPCIFVLQYALAAQLLRQSGPPDAVIGHSAGEVAAALAAGTLSLDDAARVMVAHSRLIAALDPGAMWHVAASAAVVQEALAALAETAQAVELAALNGPHSTVVSGPVAALEALQHRLQAQGLETRRLNITVPFHTRAVELHLPALRQALAGLSPRTPNLPLWSAWRGGVAQPGDFSADYWARHIREPVQFNVAMAELLRTEHRPEAMAVPLDVIEVGPHPVLLHAVDDLAQSAGVPVRLHAALERPTPSVAVSRSAAGARTAATGPASQSSLADTFRQALRDVLGEAALADTEYEALMEYTWSEIGCGSLRLAQLMRTLAERLQRPVPITLPYRHPTPATLLAALDREQAVVDTEPTEQHHEADVAASYNAAASADAPLAIVGLACRLPGNADSAAGLWDLLVRSEDPIREVPPERWDAQALYDPVRGTPGRSVSRWGGFIERQDLRDFDARHFRMTPREASALDPQQRLLLEVAWEALENAALSPAELKGQRVGVYVGLSTDDHKHAVLYRDLTELDPYCGTGAMSCTAAGRLSYFFGFEGPCMAVDTACSSSLVALQLACQALRSGECDYALVGAVNAMLSPHLYVYFSQAGILSPTGRCHVFDAAADGYVRAEGCGVLVLQREDLARAEGRRVRARVLSCVVNQDGASSGFSAPNGEAQRKLLREAWRRAGVSPQALGYLEAHGTGTPVGDPIELEALARALGDERVVSDPLWVGSLKSNLGHLEAAAGVGALIKTVLALEHEAIPGNLHFEQPNPRIDWSRLPLRVAQGLQPWVARDGRRIAGISSFGFSGTNAHAVLEQGDPPVGPEAARDLQLVCLSSLSAEVLRDQARRLAERLIGQQAPSVVAVLAALHRARSSQTSRLSHRLALAAAPEALAERLLAWSQGHPAADVCTGYGDPGPLVFAFTGQGCQYPGMAADLYQAEPVFRAVVDLCDALLSVANLPQVRRLLLDPNGDPAALADTALAQPALFVQQCALVELLASWGVQPQCVVGHSVGEFAAAVAAGVLTLEDALHLVVERGRCMARMPTDGAMVAVQVDEVTAQAALGPEADSVALAAVNGERAVVFSGDALALQAVLSRLGPAGARARRLQVNQAYHSPAMASAADAFAALPAPPTQPAKLRWISSVDARDWQGSSPTLADWAGQMRAGVRFHSALQRLEAEGCRTFVEIGPASVLTVLGRGRGPAHTGNTQSAEAPRPLWLAAQERGRSGQAVLAQTVAALAARGVPVDWTDYAGVALSGVDLPPYPFDRRRHWRDRPVAPSHGAMATGSATPVQTFDLPPYDWLNQHALALLAQQLAQPIAVAPRWQRHHSSCLALLAESGPTAGLPAPADAVAYRERFVHRHPSLVATLELLEDCVTNYPAILADQLDPMTVLFREGRLDRVASVYANNEVQDRFNAALGQAVARRLSAEATRRGQGSEPVRLRVIEVGAGTGSATQAVLSQVPAGVALDYVFTDLSAAFLARARQRFAGLQCAVLDIERDPAAQGFERGSFDLVIAHNVLHASADLPQALTHTRWLCAPSASLVLGEQTRLQAFIHLIFGLTDGWWRFTDALRTSGRSPLLNEAGWLQALQAAGFGLAEVDASAVAGQAVFMAPVIEDHPSMSSIPMPSSQPTAGALARIRAIVADLTGLKPDEIGDDTPLMDLGLDSLMLVQLRGLLARDEQIEVDLADFYGDRDTPIRLAALLTDRLAAVAGMASSPMLWPVTPAAQPEPPAWGMALPAAAPVAAVGPAATAPAGDLARLMALQLETMSRLLSEQNALLAGGPARVAPEIKAQPTAPAPGLPAPAVPARSSTAAPSPAAEAQRAPPNFRSIQLDEDRLTPTQKDFIDALARRYNKRTARSKALTVQSRISLCDWKNTLGYRHSLKEMMYPITAARSQGAYFTDIDGHEYLDLTMGCGIALLGHSPEPVRQALHAQVDAHYAIGPQTDLAADVAARFARFTGMERVTFCNTGAEAVMMAVRIARAVTGRRRLVVFTGAYHGTWDGVLGVEHEGHIHPIDRGIPPGMVQDLTVLNYGTAEALEALSGCAHEVAAVLVEPVQSRRPSFHPAEFLRELRRITQAKGAALIFDEMITGFRIAPGGGQAHFGVRADLATYGKIVGGGLPLSVVAGSARFMDVVDGGGTWSYGDDSRPHDDVIYFGGTYVKHPLALAAAQATLAHLEALGPAAYDTLNARSTRLAATLNDWFTRESVPLVMTHFGSLFRIEGTGRFSPVMQPLEVDLFFLLLNLQGLYVWERRICFLSMAHGDAELERVFHCVQQAVDELRAGGFAFSTDRKSAPTPAVQRPAGQALASSAQRRMFALAEIDGPSVVYNVPLAFHLRGALQRDRLEEGIAALVRRHPALRTRFAVIKDTLVQQVEPDVQVPVQWIDTDEHSVSQCLRDLVHPFALGQAPLMRAAVLCVSPAHHVLFLDAHHIVADGLSLNILARELMALYQGQTLAAPAADMSDHALAEADYLRSPQCQRDAAFWREQFLELPEPLALPLRGPRPQRRRHQGEDLLACIDRETTAQLKAAARAQRIPLFPLMLALYQVLLQRFTGQAEQVVGLPVGGRSDPQFRDTVGMLANTLPLRLAISPDTPLADAARACHRVVLQAMTHQGYPMESLVASLELPRDTSRNPLFDTMFIFEDGNDRVFRVPGLDCSAAAVTRQAAMFDLCLEVVEADGEMQLRCEYDTDLLDPVYARQMLDSYVQLVQGASQAMDQACSQLELIDAPQRARVLAWGDGGQSAGGGRDTVTGLLQQQLARAGAGAALISASGRHSLGELDAAARTLAKALRAAGVAPSAAPVALVCARDHTLLVGMLGIMYAGGAYLPIDPQAPVERNRRLLRAASCRVAVASPATSGVEALQGLQTLDMAQALAAPSSAALAEPVAVTADDLANVLFTSGSTGEPKGVMVRHGNLAALFAALPGTLGLGPDDRVLAVTATTFDISGLELLGALCCGACVVLADEAQVADPAKLRALIQQEAVTLVQMPPARLRALGDAHERAQALRGVRTLLLGGEALPTDLAAELRQYPGTAVFNVYGPTETAIWSTFARLDEHPPHLGRPFPGERVRVLSPQGLLQPPGALGEIALSGVGVSAGYLGDAALTARRFVALPGDDGPVYLTGDQGRWRSDGQLEFLGRIDGQIKLRGLRIELGEIEHHLRRLPGVSDAVALLQPGALGEPELVAYLLGEGTGDAQDQARALLARQLPGPMLPTRWVWLPTWPLKSSGKLDRAALQALGQARPVAVAPRAAAHPDELALAAAFSAVLGRDTGPDDDFFISGGESIRALQLVGRIHALGWAFELRDLFRWPTAAALATHLQRLPVCETVTNADTMAVPNAQPAADHAAPFTVASGEAAIAIGAFSGLDGAELAELLH